MTMQTSLHRTAERKSESSDTHHRHSVPALQRLRQRHLQQTIGVPPMGVIEPKTTAAASPPLGVMQSPTVSPVTETVPFRTSVSLQWSLIVSSIDTPSPQATATWLLRDFLCLQQDLWMANPMNILQSDCDGTQQSATGLHQVLQEYNIVLWNEPIVNWYWEQIENFHYEVWNAQYPLFTNWTTTTTTTLSKDDETLNHAQSIQQTLQQNLDDSIVSRQLQSDRGLVSIVGRELETIWLKGNAKLPTMELPTTDNNPTPVPKLPLVPHSPTPLVMIGAVIVLVHTLTLGFLHFVLKPYLQKRLQQEQQRREGDIRKEASKESFDNDDDDLLPSFLAPSYQIQRSVRPPTHYHVTMVSPQMPNDESSSHVSVLDKGYGSAEEEEEEDIEVVSILGSTCSNNDTALAFLTAPYLGNAENNIDDQSTDADSSVLIYSC